MEISIPTTQAAREKMLQAYLQQHGMGPLPQRIANIIREMFRLYYHPDEGEEKYDWQQIASVAINTAGAYGTKCFYIHLTDGTSSTVSLRRLAGKAPSKAVQLNLAMRAVIQPQIEEFRRANPLNPTDPCPILPTLLLGHDAQVDHIVPFATLRDQWLQETQHAPSVYYNPESQAYIFKKEADAASWATYHKKNAQLRYLSREGNKRAHLI